MDKAVKEEESDPVLPTPPAPQVNTFVNMEDLAEVVKRIPAETAAAFHAIRDPKPDVHAINSGHLPHETLRWL